MQFRVAGPMTMEMDFTRTGPTVQMHVFTREEEAVTWTWPYMGVRWGKEPEDRKRLYLAALALGAPSCNHPEPLPICLPPTRGPGEGESLSGPVLGEGRQEGPAL